MSQGVVTVAFTMAFMVSFNTPTIALGCRSLLYLIWYLLSNISWVILGFWQEPWRSLRVTSWVSNATAACCLFFIMGMQLTNGLNRCVCKGSVFFGTGTYGGYMDFENGSFYRQMYRVQIYWSIAAALGFAGCVVPIAWAVRRWGKSSNLWKTSEDSLPEDMSGMRMDWLS